MKKNIYVMKLKNLQNQINAMLQEAESIVVKTGAQVARDRMSDAVAFFSDPESPEFNDPKSGKVAQLVGSFKAKSYLKYNEFLTWSEKNADMLAKAKKGGIIAAAVIAVGTTTVIAREKWSINKLVSNTDKAINSENYAEMTKYIGALKKMSSGNFWNKLMVTSAAREGAAKNVEVFRKSYIGVGSALVLCSIIALLIAGTATDVLSTLWSAVKSLNLSNIAKAMGSLLAVAALMIPAIIGVAFIYIGVKGFPEGGMAAQFASILSPCIKVCNMIVKQVMEMANSASAKSAYVKSLKSAKKLNYLAF